MTVHWYSIHINGIVEDEIPKEDYEIRKSVVSDLGTREEEAINVLLKKKYF